MTDPFRLDGQVALITGASRGIGAATASALAAAGATVFLSGRDAATLEQAAATIGDAAHVLAFDATDEAAATAAVGHIVDTAGRLDILVNNAGTVDRSPLLQGTTDAWRRVVDLNLTAAYVIAREAARPMVDRGAGRIITTASALSILGRAAVTAYTATKHGVAGLTKSLAAELGPHGITANAICPGYIRTELTGALQQDAAFSRDIEAHTPLGRWGEPGEIANTALFLASPAASYVNGHLLVVDGGLTSTLMI